MIPVRIRPDFRERVKKDYPHLPYNFIGFENLQRYINETVYVDDFELSLVNRICDLRGNTLISGSKIGVAVYYPTAGKTFKDYL